MPMTPRRLSLAAMCVLAALLSPATPASAEPAQRPVLLAQFSDPSMPLPPRETRRRAPRPSPDIPPFALPTAPLTTPRPAPEIVSPGGGEFPPYEKELLRLAEILGAVHYLSGLCGDSHDDTWRVQMERLLDAEAARATWRERLVGSFNSGYRGFERTYRSCTPAAARASELYLVEGQQLTGAIKARYAN